MGDAATDEPSVVVVSVEGPTGKLFLVNTNEIEDVVMNRCLDQPFFGLDFGKQTKWICRILEFFA